MWMLAKHPYISFANMHIYMAYSDFRDNKYANNVQQRKERKKKKERHKGCITELDEPAHWKTWHEISKHCNTQGPNDTEQ